MNVEQITLDKEVAKEKFEAYRSKLAKMKIGKANAEVAREYKAAMDGYKALANGTPLIDLEDVFRDCPTDEKFRPRLAIGRADVRQIRFNWEGGSSDASFVSSAHLWSLLRQVRIPMGKTNTFNAYRPTWDLSVDHYQRVEGFSLVPLIPADKLPSKCNLSKHWILWEVEKWSDTKIGVQPDRDPYLLKHLGGSLYAVIAEWDLTDLERSIMKGRKE